MKAHPKLIASALTAALLAGAVYAAPTGCPPNDPTCKPCPKGWQWVPKLKTCTKPTEIRHDLPKNDPETGSDAGGTLPHPWDPIPPHPRPTPVLGSDTVPIGHHMPRDPGNGSGAGPNPGDNPVEPALPNGPKPIKLDKPTVAPHKVPPPKPVDCRFVKPFPTC
jgi:hypothetical protein